MHMSHAREMLMVVLNTQIYYPIWLEIIVILISIVLQVGLRQKRRKITIFPNLFSLFFFKQVFRVWGSKK